METVINIFTMKINSVSNNGSVNIGEVLHNAHTANTKSQGLNSSYGDFAPPTAAMENVFIDPDVNDMGDIAILRLSIVIQHKGLRKNAISDKCFQYQDECCE